MKRKVIKFANKTKLATSVGNLERSIKVQQDFMKTL